MSETKYINCPKCDEENPAQAVMCWACYTPLTSGALQAPRGKQASKPPFDWATIYVPALFGGLVGLGYLPRRVRPVASASVMGAISILGLVQWSLQKRSEKKWRAEKAADPESEKPPIQRILETICGYAVRDGATRIKITHETMGIGVQYLIGDVWHDQMKIPRYVYEPLCSEPYRFLTKPNEFELELGGEHFDILDFPQQRRRFVFRHSQEFPAEILEIAPTPFDLEKGNPLPLLEFSPVVEAPFKPSNSCIQESPLEVAGILASLGSGWFGRYRFAVLLTGGGCWLASYLWNQIQERKQQKIASAKEESEIKAKRKRANDTARDLVFLALELKLTRWRLIGGPLGTLAQRPDETGNWVEFWRTTEPHSNELFKVTENYWEDKAPKSAIYPLRPLNVGSELKFDGGRRTLELSLETTNDPHFKREDGGIRSHAHSLSGTS